MKTKIKRHSRAVLSIVLTLCMLVSCMTVGIIATDAAKDDSESVGANVEFYYDFTQLTSGGYNYINASGVWSNGTDRSQIIKGSYPDNDSGRTIAKWEQGGWDNINVKVSDIPAGKNMMIAHGDNTVTWGVYGESGGGGGGSGGTSVTDNDLIAVLKRTKIMIYFGDKWGSGTKYVKNGTSANSNATSGTSETLTIDNTDCHVANGYITVNTQNDKYSISNQESSWAGMSINSGNDMTTSQGGYLYYMYNDGSNKLVTKTSNAAVSWTTSTDTITEGDSSCSIAATASGTTGAGRSVSVKYYYTKNNTDFYTFDPSDTSELTAGTYTIYATAYDTKIHVAVSTQATLTVEEPEAKPTHTITVNTNNSAYGTASASVASAYQGQEVTLTATESTGTFNKWVLTSGTVSSVDNSTTNPLTFTMGSTDLVITANFTENTAASPFYYNSYGSNGQPAATHYGAQMNEAKLNGETYSYYHVQGRDEADQLFTVSYGSPKYNSYNTYFQFPKSWGGTAEVQFYTTDGKNLGNYTNMTADGEENGKLKWKYPIPDGAREVQFKHGSDYSGKLNFASGNNAWYVESKMNEVSGWNSSNPVPTNFYENFYDANKYTNAFSTKGFYNHGASRGENHDYTKPKDLGSTKGDYYIVVLYKNKTYTINGVTKTISNDPEIIWMSTLPSAVEDTTETVDIYAKNGTLRDSTFNRFTNLADTDFDIAYFEYTESLDSGVVTYDSIAAYNAAHSKTITYDNAVSGYNSDYAIMRNVPIGAKIKIKTTLSNDGTKAGSFNNTAFKDTHYLKAYSFNGMSYQVNTPNSEGVYDEIWTVRDVNTKSVSGSTVTNLTKDGKTIEVTPIYYMKDNTNCKTFYIDGYDGTVQNAWGNMLCVYPYYEGKSNAANAFGGYPGQPMLFWGGKYQMEIPLTVDGTASGASVKGLTLHNGYWDLLHRSLDIRCNDRNHAQTYDYDDFYKLYKEKNPDTIIFDFKFRNNSLEDHYNDGYQYTKYDFAGDSGSEAAHAAADFVGSGKNGVELLTDYFGRQVDAFGTLIADANKSHYGEDNNGTPIGQTNELLFVSTGYKDTYVGEYATLWAVYAPNGNFIGYISSSMLYLNSWDRRLQYTGGDSTDSGRMSWAAFQTTYNTLKTNYKGVPALISYEKELWNDSKDKAYRSDGKWYYSNKSDKISASIKIQYGAYSLFEAPDHSVSSDAWSDDPFDENETGVGGYKNIGTSTECAAYFTNTTPNLLGKVASGEQFADSTKKFTFQAVPSGSYMFAGWVRYSNGKYYEITENEIGESPMSANDVYIARFVTAKTGTLTIQHVVEQTNDFNGTGTPSLTVTVKDGSGNNVSGSPFTVSDGSKIDISKWIDSHFNDYTIDISLTTTPTNESFMKEIGSSSGSYAASPNTWNASYDKTNSSGADTAAKTATVARFTVQNILSSGITSLRYVSHLMKPVYTYQYEIVYTYTSRFWGVQSYTQTGTAAEGDFTGSKTSALLTTDFIIGKTPYEKNFRQQINWNYTNAAVTTGDVTANAMTNTAATDQGSNTYKMTAYVYASNTVNDKVTAEFVLPYKYNAKSQGYTAKDTNVYTGNDITGKTYLYDTGNESVSLSAKAYSLFTYDDKNHTGSDDTLASSLPLMEAAPYVWMNVNYHTKPANTKRYYTGNSFKVGNTTYYLRAKPDGSAAGTNEEIITDEAVRNGKYTVTFTKRSNKTEYGGDNHTTTYRYAVAEGTPGTVGYKVYFFAYNMNASEQMTTNDGTVITEEEFIDGIDPVFNGQYIVYTETEEKDGVIANSGVQKFFTRWDVYNTKGDFVASCYNRRFSYSGYDNYVVRPVYASNTENSYASTLGDGYKSTITYLDDSRNQWNNNGSGNYNSETKMSDALYAGDKIFTDFAITYAYEGKDLNKVTSDEAKIRTGIVIERLDLLDEAGGKKITDASYYADKYKTDEDWKQLQSALANGNPKLTAAVRTVGTENTHTCYNSKIGTNYNGYVDDGYTMFGTAAPGATIGQSSVVDNFNRLQWFYTFNVTTQATSDSNTITATMKNYAYRAVSYMIVEKNGSTTAYLTDTPAYFTIYDTASRAYN